MISDMQIENIVRIGLTYVRLRIYLGLGVLTGKLKENIDKFIL